METRQRDELEFVAHRAEFALELGNCVVVQLALPVERRRTVVSQHLAGELLMNSLGKMTSFIQVRLARFAPDQISIRRISQAAIDGLIEAVTYVEETFSGAFA